MHREQPVVDLYSKKKKGGGTGWGGQTEFHRSNSIRSSCSSEGGRRPHSAPCPLFAVNGGEGGKRDGTNPRHRRQICRGSEEATRREEGSPYVGSLSGKEVETLKTRSKIIKDLSRIATVKFTNYVCAPFSKPSPLFSPSIRATIFHNENENVFSLGFVGFATATLLWLSSMERISPSFPNKCCNKF